MFKVLVSKVCKINSSAGMQNTASLASYTRMASLFALVAWDREYFKYLKMLFLARWLPPSSCRFHQIRSGSDYCAAIFLLG